MFFYRDIVEFLTYLEENPAFEGFQHHQPVKWFSDAELKEWIYGELHTGDAWNFWQSVIPKESTVHPVIPAADATHVTNFSGDGKVHPVYVSSDHISTEICNQPS